MDAVSFVLGLDAKKLRGTSLGDLVYDDGQNGPKPEECFVRMTFVDATGEDHIFTRFVRKHLQKDGAISWKSEYSYRGKKDQKSYEAGLSSLGVSIAIPNCLVFQVCHRPPLLSNDIFPLLLTLFDHYIHHKRQKYLSFLFLII